VRKTLSVPSDIRHRVERGRGDLEGLADDTIERALRRLRIPTRRDIDRINERLERISGQLKKAGIANGAKSRPRKRKVN
jgi:hypothetical protein